MSAKWVVRLHLNGDNTIQIVSDSVYVDIGDCCNVIHPWTLFENQAPAFPFAEKSLDPCQDTFVDIGFLKDTPLSKHFR